MSNDDRDHPDDDGWRPSHQVLFAPLKGRTEDGLDILGPPRAMRAVSAHEYGEGGMALRFARVPTEMREQGSGVVFINKLPEREQTKSNDRERDR